MNETIYVAPTYEPSNPVQTFFSTPRFGHTNDFVTLVDGEGRTDYIQGLLFASALCLVIFLIWSFMLLVFKCCGKDRVGFCAGSGFRSNPGCCCPFSARFICILASGILIVSCVLISTKGVQDIEAAVDNVADSSDTIRDLVSELKNYTEELDAVGRSAIPTRDQIVLSLGEDLCPAQGDLQDQIDIAKSNGLDVTSQEAQIETIETLREQGLAASSRLTDLSNFINDVVTNFNDIYSSYIEFHEEGDKWLKELKDRIIWLAYFVIPIGVIAGFFCLGVFMEVCGLSAGIFKCLLNWIFLPLFILMVLVFAIIGLAIFPAGIINSDFCLDGSLSGSPEGTIKSLMESQGMNLNTTSSRVLLHYMEGCTSEDPLSQVQNYLDDLLSADIAIMDLGGYLGDFGTDLETICGADYGPLETQLDTLGGYFQTLLNAANGTLSIAECESLNPIYVSLVHESACTDLPNSIAWVFGTFIVIAITGFVIITFRAAWRDVDDDSYSSRDSRYRKGGKAAVY